VLLLVVVLVVVELPPPPQALSATKPMIAKIVFKTFITDLPITI